MKMGRLTLQAVALLALSGGLVAAQNSAQTQHEITRRIPVTIVEPTANTGDGSTISRRTHNGNDVIILPFNATAAQLSSGFLALMQLQDTNGDAADRDGMFRIPASVVAKPQKYLDSQSATTLRKLSEQPPVTYVGVDTAKEYTIYVPNRALRDQLRASGHFKFGQQ